MFFEPAKFDRTILPHDPFKALVAPRPIGWISSVDPEGRVNLAPYSFFNAFSDRPHIVGFSSDGMKDSIRNIEATGAFVCNLVSYSLREAMNQTAKPLPYGESEMAAAGIEAAPSKLVKPPRVKDAAWALECTFLRTVPMAPAKGEARYFLVLGEVVGIYIDDRFIHEGRVDTAAMQPMARAGYDEYGVMDKAIRMTRPM